MKQRAISVALKEAMKKKIQNLKDEKQERINKE